VRTKNSVIVLGPDGRPLAGASVHTVVRATGVDASVYAAETGATPGTNPAVTNTHGRVTQWLERGAYTSTITGEGIEAYLEEWDSSPASDGAIDHAWVPNNLIDAQLVAMSLKPSGTAAITDEALRRIGTGADQVVAGNDPRLGGTLATRSVLDIGILNQTRAGHVLGVVSDFASALGLPTPVGLFNLSNTTNNGSGGALINKGSVPFGPGIMGAATEAALFAGSTAQALFVVDTGGGDPFRLKVGTWGAWSRTAKRGVAQFVVSKLHTSTAANNWFDLQVGSTNVLSARAWIGGTPTEVAGTTDIADDRWHFIVVTYDGSILRAYVDGVLEGSVAVTGGLLSGGACPFNIGAAAADGSTAASFPHFGRIDEAFVTPDVLSADQARLLYCARFAHGYSATPLRASLGVRRPRKGGPLVSGDFPSQPLRLHNFTAAAVTDAGSNNQSLTNTNAAVAVAGADGAQNGAFNFVGASSQSLTSTDTGLPSGTAAATLGCWVKSTLGGSGSAVNVVSYGSGSTYRCLSIGPAGLPTVADNAEGTAGSKATGTVSLLDGLWHFMVGVFDPAAADGLLRKLYVDGKLVGAQTAALVAVTLAGAGGFAIGRTNSPPLYFTGQIDGVFLHSAALTASQIASLYAKGSLALPSSPKATDAHVEAFDAANIWAVFDTLESQHQVDLAVSA